METLIELIPSLGFPIVCCVAVGFCFYQMLNKVLSDSKERENNLMQLTREISMKIAELGQLIDKNTQAISVMNEKLEKLSKEVEAKHTINGMNEKIEKLSKELDGERR